MTTNQEGLDLIKRFEGCKLTVYKDPAGVLTIGYGHTKNVKAGDKITQAQAETFLREDLKTAELVVNSKCSYLNLNENEFAALVSFTYNCGSGNLAKLIQNRGKSQIAEALLLYNKAAGQVLQGLINRRKAERALFLKQPEKPQYETFSAIVTITPETITIRRNTC